MNISKSFIKDVAESMSKYGFSAGGSGVNIIEPLDNGFNFNGVFYPVSATTTEEYEHIYDNVGAEAMELFNETVLNSLTVKTVKSGGNEIHFSVPFSVYTVDNGQVIIIKYKSNYGSDYTISIMNYV